MAWEIRHLTREELYHMVWDSPVQQVAQRIGVSGVALGKTCRRLGVPVPGRGYWARKAAGASLRLPPLPKATRGQEASYSVRRWVDPLIGGATVTTQGPSVKSEPITVPDELADPHPLVAASLPLLRQAKELREDLLERESCLSIVVQTHSLVGRAIRIMDTLLKTLQARGFALEITPPTAGPPDPYGKRAIAPSATVAQLGDTVIRFGIHEGSDRVPVTPSPKRRGIFDTYTPRPEYKSVPNGKLSLCILSYHHGLQRQTWTDGKRQRLETCLTGFVSVVMAVPERERAIQLAEAQRQREWEEQRRAQAERERQRALEAERVKDLDARLGDRNKAKAIMELAAAIELSIRERGDPLDPASSTAEWLSWARTHARLLEERAITIPSPAARSEEPAVGDDDHDGDEDDDEDGDH